MRGSLAGGAQLLQKVQTGRGVSEEVDKTTSLNRFI